MLKIVVNEELYVQNASVDIPILELSSGINVGNATYQFSFSPKGFFVNVTKIYVLLGFAWSGSPLIGSSVKCTLNDIATIQASGPLLSSGEFITSVCVTDPLFTGAMKSNQINTLTIFLEDPSTYVYFKQCKIALSVEYQTLA